MACTVRRSAASFTHPRKLGSLINNSRKQQKQQEQQKQKKKKKKNKTITSSRNMSSKIKDCLFMGDIDSAQDVDFLRLNGITRIINCVPRCLPNVFANDGVHYTNNDDLGDVLQRDYFDLRNKEIVTVMKTIDNAVEATESVLVHSLHGLNRSPSIMIAYLMYKYCW